MTVNILLILIKMYWFDVYSKDGILKKLFGYIKNILKCGQIDNYYGGIESDYDIELLGNNIRNQLDSYNEKKEVIYLMLTLKDIYLIKKVTNNPRVKCFLQDIKDNPNYLDCYKYVVPITDDIMIYTKIFNYRYNSYDILNKPYNINTNWIKTLFPITSGNYDGIDSYPGLLAFPLDKKYSDVLGSIDLYMKYYSRYGSYLKSKKSKIDDIMICLHGIKRRELYWNTICYNKVTGKQEDPPKSINRFDAHLINKHTIGVLDDCTEIKYFNGTTYQLMKVLGIRYDTTIWKEIIQEPDSRFDMRNSMIKMTIEVRNLCRIQYYGQPRETLKLRIKNLDIVPNEYICESCLTKNTCSKQLFQKYWVYSMIKNIEPLCVLNNDLVLIIQKEICVLNN